MDATSLFLSIVISAIGFAYFTYGRKSENYPALVSGVLMMVYPYFITGAGLSIFIGLVLMAAPYIISRYF